MWSDAGMITPLLQNDTLLADIVSIPAADANFHLWWLGQSGFLLKWRSSSVLFDPYLSDSLSRKYAGTDKEHVRMTERCIAPEQLGFVDIVTSSHAHTDHLDAESLRPLAHQLAIPHHFEMFQFNTATPDDFIAECLRLGQEHRVLRCGERWSSSALLPRVTGAAGFRAEHRCDPDPLS